MLPVPRYSLRSDNRKLRALLLPWTELNADPESKSKNTFPAGAVGHSRRAVGKSSISLVSSSRPGDRAARRANQGEPELPGFFRIPHQLECSEIGVPDTNLAEDGSAH